MQLVATLAVVLSVLALAYQARELARHSRIANEVAAVQADCDLLRMDARVQETFIQYPELRARFYDQATAPIDDTESRLLTIATQQADVLLLALDATYHLGPYGWRREEIEVWANDALATSTPLRAIIRDNPDLWPSLESLVANYDASHDQRAHDPTAQPAPVVDAPSTPDPDQQ